MTSPTRWKALCAVLAALTVYTWTRRPAIERVQASPTARSRMLGHRPLRVSAAALGTSTEEIVARLLASESMPEMRKLAEQLGAVGDDSAIDAVVKLVADSRPGVPELIITAIGTIGTDHAVDVLIDLADDARSDVKWAAITALGSTGSERAEMFLVALARKNDPAAIGALGALASDRAVEVLYRIASAGSDDAARQAVSTIGSIDTPAARDALARLIDSPSLEIATKALASVQNVDDELLEKLTGIAKGGEVQLARAATLAIAHVGDGAVPLLRELATASQATEVRIAAVQALGSIRSDAVVETLSALVEEGDDEVAREAARSLAQSDAPEARDVLISAALSDRAEATGAVDALVTMTGPDIDQALLEIAKADQHGADKALTRLLSQESDDALALVVARAGTGSVDERFEALQLLADAGTDATSSTLLSLVRGERGELKTRALELVTRTRSGDPKVTELLRESLHAGDADERRAAATALGRVGTDDARDALVAALSTRDSELQQTALGALAAYRLDESACNAIYSAGISDPSLMHDAMRRLFAAGSATGLRLADVALAGEPYAAIRTLQLLAETNPPGATELLLRSVRASDENVRAAALRTIATTRAPGATDAVAAAVRDPSSRVRESAASTLGSLGGDRARDALIEMTRSSNARDRLVALQNLPDDPAAMSRIRELLRDGDSNVVYSAMRSLASSRDGATTLRAFVLDGSRPDDARLDAAYLLQGYGALDAATEAWLEQTRSAAYADYDY